MIISTSQFGTTHGAEYLKQLCAHFSKRVPVQAQSGQAQVTLPIGTCDLTASGDGFAACIQSCPDHIDRMEEMFGGWIERIAFRENAILTWHRAAHQSKD
ncbi:DUF2218 domain-containing protein [Roseovarius sp. 2305UL8-3]|uniref:DUF2218 domain-containing protein n=1 Tax=Roseovarius conchicola TaxID=3121636 RepID=UPI0035270379